MRIFFLFLFLYSSLFSSDTITSQMQDNAVALYDTFFQLVRDFRWVFAMVPLIAVGVSVSKDIAKLKEEKASMMQQEKINGEDVFVLVTHSVVTLLGIFMIYGIFGLTFADASSMQEVWDKLVVAFWRSVV